MVAHYIFYGIHIQNQRTNNSIVSRCIYTSWDIILFIGTTFARLQEFFGMDYGKLSKKWHKEYEWGDMNITSKVKSKAHEIMLGLRYTF